jgi:hypothetical protein
LGTSDGAQNLGELVGYIIAVAMIAWTSARTVIRRKSLHNNNNFRPPDYRSGMAEETKQRFREIELDLKERLEKKLDSADHSLICRVAINEANKELLQVLDKRFENFWDNFDKKWQLHTTEIIRIMKNGG